MLSTDFETVELTHDEETGIARLVLDRPDSLNALSATLRREYVEAFQSLADYDAEAEGCPVRAVVVSGAGRAFCAGADVNEFAEGSALVRPDVVYEAASRLPAPVVAEIDGYCLGGGLALALDCDFRFASDQSEFGLPEVDLGLTVAGRTLPTLRAELGPSGAKRLAVTGERIDGPAAATAGLIEESCPAADLPDRVTAFTTTLAEKPPLAVRETLDVVDAVGPDGGYRTEIRAAEGLHRTRDHREAVRGFREETDVEFRGE